MMLTYARVRGLRRWMIPVPVLTPRLSSYWVGLISPIPAGIARPLIEGLRNEVVIHHPTPAGQFPVRPMAYVEALRLAIDRTDRHEVETTWFDARSAPGRQRLDLAGSREGMIVDRHARHVAASPERVFAEVERLGGRSGWRAVSVVSPTGMGYTRSTRSSSGAPFECSRPEPLPDGVRSSRRADAVGRSVGRRPPSNKARPKSMANDYARAGGEQT